MLNVQLHIRGATLHYKCPWSTMLNLNVWCGCHQAQSKVTEPSGLFSCLWKISGRATEDIMKLSSETEESFHQENWTSCIKSAALNVHCDLNKLHQLTNKIEVRWMGWSTKESACVSLIEIQTWNLHLHLSAPQHWLFNKNRLKTLLCTIKNKLYVSYPWSVFLRISLVMSLGINKYLHNSHGSN